jgi:hypothetical protein
MYVNSKTISKLKFFLGKISVADPGGLSRILIFYPSRIPDPKTATKEGVKINLL